MLVVGLLLVAGLAGCSAVGAGGEDAPPAPRDLAATPSDGTVTLAWASVEAAAGYHVYRSDTSFAELTEATKVSGESPLGEAAYADSTLINGSAYYYRVTAVGEGDAESDASGEASATPLPAPPARP
jgi:fibronectin type 3 domain-containing protein